jgi:hypothetical protein
MMKYIYTLLAMFVFCTSCTQSQSDRSKKIIKSDNKEAVTSTNANQKYTHTQYAYTDPTGASLIIQNGGPKGGAKYTAPNGAVYNYAIFWTRLINETAQPLKLSVSFPVNAYEVPSLPGNYLKILIPPDTMTLDREPLPFFGLTDLAPFFDRHLHQNSILKRTINPKESSGFFVVILSLAEGAHGTVRTGLHLKGQNLFYRIKIDGSKSNTKSADNEIRCGSINLRDLV